MILDKKTGQGWALDKRDTVWSVHVQRPQVPGKFPERGLMHQLSFGADRQLARWRARCTCFRGRKLKIQRHMGTHQREWHEDGRAKT